MNCMCVYIYFVLPKQSVHPLPTIYKNISKTLEILLAGLCVTRVRSKCVLHGCGQSRGQSSWLHTRLQCSQLQSRWQSSLLKNILQHGRWQSCRLYSRQQSSWLQSIRQSCWLHGRWQSRGLDCQKNLLFCSWHLVFCRGSGGETDRQAGRYGTQATALLYGWIRVVGYGVFMLISVGQQQREPRV